MSVSNPNEQHDDSSLGIIVRYMEKTVRLEEERKKDRQELQEQISQVRQETSEMVDHRLDAFGQRFDTLDKKLDEMSKSKEAPPDGGQPETLPTQTEVDQSLGGGGESSLSNKPTELHPPPVPKGIHGRRKARKDHKA